MQGKSSVVREIRDTCYTHALTNQGVADDFGFRAQKPHYRSRRQTFKLLKKDSTSTDKMMMVHHHFYVVDSTSSGPWS